jgi:hypothetical protein
MEADRTTFAGAASAGVDSWNTDRKLGPFSTGRRGYCGFLPRGFSDACLRAARPVAVASRARESLLCTTWTSHPSSGSRRKIKWVRIKSATSTKLGQISSGVDSPMAYSPMA